MSAQQDQAAELRRLMTQAETTDAPAPVEVHAPVAPASKRPARVLAVTSGKGGVGKSNVAVNLSARLATMGRRVVMLDADLGLANADVLCNVSAKTNLAHVVAGRRALDDAMVEAPGGFTLIPGASGLAAMAALSEFERARVVAMLRQIESGPDLLVVDTGAGIGPNVMSFLLAADELLVVTTPEPTSITDAYALIKAVSRQREQLPVRLLVNMARDKAEARRVYERMAAVCRRFLGLALSDAGHVLLDPAVSQAVRRRAPFVIDAPDCPAALCVAQLAHKLDSRAAEPRGHGFFRRVASWLAG